MRLSLLIFFIICSLSKCTATKEKCLESKIGNHVEVQCSDIPVESDWKSNSYLVTHETIVCSNIEKPINLAKFPKVFLDHLIFFQLSKCKVNVLPSRFFEHTIKLQQVILDNIPITHFPENVFYNSSNLVDLSLSQLEKIERIHPRFLGYQDKLETLSVIKSNIDSNQLRPILLTVYNTLKNLYWRKNVQKLILFTKYFEHFNFDALILEYNGIDNIDFLKYVSAKTLSLKGNPIGRFQHFNFSNYQELCQTLIELDLSETEIDSTSLLYSYTNTKFPYLTDLILTNNFIDQLPKNIEKLMPSLKILDVRNNKLTTLPSLFYMLRIKFGIVFLDGNIFHCNCEMKWATMFKQKQIKDLYCQVIDKDNRTQTKLMYDKDVQQSMSCIAPKLQLGSNKELNKHLLATNIVNETLKIFQIDIFPNEILSWQCKGEGDPSPKLKWIKNHQTLKSMLPSLNKHKLTTVMKNLNIEYNDIQAANDSYDTYKCKAINKAGQSELHLQVWKRVGERQKNNAPVLGKMVDERGVNIDKSSQITLLHWNVIFIGHLIFFWFLNK